MQFQSGDQTSAIGQMQSSSQIQTSEQASTHKPGAQYYIEAGGFGKKAAQAAGAVLDKILNGEVNWKTLTNADIRKLQLSKPQGAKAVSLALGISVPKAVTITEERSTIRKAVMQFEQHRGHMANESGDLSRNQTEYLLPSSAKRKNFTGKRRSDIISALPVSCYFNSHDELFQYAQLVEPVENYEDVAIHGNKYGFEIRDADDKPIGGYSVVDFCDILKNDPNYHGGAIRLISCETGAEGAVVAQGMANILGVPVLAPTDVVWIRPNGEMVIGPDEFTSTGEWKKFIPKKGRTLL